MKTKGFVRTGAFFALISLGIFLYSLYQMDPRSGVISVAVFLGSLFVLIASIYAVVSFSIMNKLRNNETYHFTLISSIRRGALLGFYIVASLSLSALQLLTWWDALLLAFSLVLFELYFISGKERVI